MKKNSWLKGAVLLGLSFFLAIILIKPIGVSTQFSVLSGIVHSSIDQDVIKVDDERKSGYKSTNEYYDKSEGKLAESIKNPINYDFIFVLAIPFGGLLGSIVLNKRRNSKFSEVEEENKVCENGICSIKKEGFIKSYLPSFLGGFLLLFAARMADGCTSGHMMSGMMQGSVSGYFFAGSVFLTAIPVAIFVKKIRVSK